MGWGMSAAHAPDLQKFLAASQFGFLKWVMRSCNMPEITNKKKKFERLFASTHDFAQANFCAF
jgi:hypothetical protein